MANNSESKCKKCGNRIVNNEDLKNALIKEEMQIFRDLQKTTIENIIFRCKVCFFHHMKRANMNRHIFCHYKRGELTHCATCQKSINEISIELLPDPQTEVGFSQPTTRSSFVCSANRFDFDSLPVSMPWLPIDCPNCNKVFDYMGPLVCKLIASVYREVRRKKEITRRRVVICRICLEESEDKGYVVAHAFNHVKEGTVICKPCREKKGGSPIFTPPKEMLCQQCTKPLKDIKDLQKRLIIKYVYNTGQSESIFDRSKKKQGTICYICRLCLYRHRGQRIMNSHLNGHFKRNEVSYCSACQKAMDELRIDALPDPKNKSDLLRPSSASEVILSTNKRSSVSTTVPTPWKSIKCGKCEKAFDYLGSFLYKLLDENVQEYVDEKGNTKTREIFICRLCSIKGENKQAMELHACKHTSGKDILCKRCQENKERVTSTGSYSEQKTQPKDLIFTDMDRLIRCEDHELEEILLTETLIRSLAVTA